METLGVRNCVFPSLLHLKADDTYLQLKKDLEYLDLKVSDIRVPAFLVYSPFQECHLTGARPKAKGQTGLTQSEF